MDEIDDYNMIFKVGTPAGCISIDFTLEDEPPIWMGDPVAIEYFKKLLNHVGLTGEHGRTIMADNLDPDNLYNFVQRKELGVTVVAPFAYLQQLDNPIA